MSDEFHENCWKAMPVDLKRKAVDYLKKEIADDQLQIVRDWYAEDPDGWPHNDHTPVEKQEEIKDKHGFYIPTMFHFGAGMGIRNLLREVIKDGELPDARGLGYPDYDSSPEPIRNWDDYYIQVIEAAAGVRSLD